MTDMVDPPHCEDSDVFLEKWTFVRYLVLGSIMLIRAFKIKAQGAEQAEEEPKDLPFRDHPNLTRAMNKSNIIVSIALALCLFVQSEGVGLAIYFGVSALLDNATIYLIPNVQFCEYVVQVAIYSMAMVTFLPNVFISFLLQRSWYDQGEWYGKKAAFVLLMVFVSMVSFGIRLLLVYKLGWDDFIDSQLHDFPWKVWAAIVLPPVVDALQTLLLIVAGTHSASPYEVLPPSPASDVKCEAANLLQSSPASDVKCEAANMLQSSPASGVKS